MQESKFQMNGDIVELYRYKISYMSIENGIESEMIMYAISDTHKNDIIESLGKIKSTVEAMDQSQNDWINGMRFPSMELALDAFQNGLSYMQKLKLSEIGTACHASIVSGFNVVLQDGKEHHFSLEETDQINLSTAVMAIKQGAQGYPWHSDGDMCRFYSAKDIDIIGTAATMHKLYHTTYCNHLNVWINRAREVNELNFISYGSELPKDLNDNMQAIIVAVKGAG